MPLAGQLKRRMYKKMGEDIYYVAIGNKKKKNSYVEH